MAILSIFDLDGVVIDNREFEANVHDILVSELAIRRSCTREAARELWEAQLQSSFGNVRWADYAFHCEALALGEVYREAHYASSFLLMMNPDAQRCLEEAAMQGPLWLATDATGWAWRLKLESLGVPFDVFEETFDLDRCGVPKHHQQYWKIVEERREQRALTVRYFDDRPDCLAAAAAVLQDTSTNLVIGGDLVGAFSAPV
jgi:FMN phosphatase YigB (HAD superfamily)